MSGAGADFWVFGYGSLMWDPGFPFLDAEPALLHGYHRRFCLYSFRYRGTKECPGLVLGLDHGGACRGVAFRIAAERATEVRTYLWEREMPTGAYVARTLRVSLSLRRSIEALAFVVDPTHAQYTGHLDEGEVARLIARGCGTRGHNRAYLDATVSHLRAIGLPDRRLETLAAKVGALAETVRAAQPA